MYIYIIYVEVGLASSFVSLPLTSVSSCLLCASNLAHLDFVHVNALCIVAGRTGSSIAISMGKCLRGLSRPCSGVEVIAGAIITHFPTFY